MKKSRTLWERAHASFSVSLQAGALLCVLLTPIFFHENAQKSGADSVELAKQQRLFQAEERSLQTEIVQLHQWGHESWQSPVLHIHTASSQLRFEILPAQVSSGSRLPASAEDWRLKKIKRIHSPEVEEELTLLADEFGDPISTSYLEVFDEETHFEVVFENSANSKEITRSLVVKQEQRR